MKFKKLFFPDKAKIITAITIFFIAPLTFSVIVWEIYFLPLHLLNIFTLYAFDYLQAPLGGEPIDRIFLMTDIIIQSAWAYFLASLAIEGIRYLNQK